VDKSYDWKAKWQEKRADDIRILRVAELPFPFSNGDCLMVEDEDGSVYAVRASGMYASSRTHLDLLPVPPPPPEPVAWSKPEDVDPLIERVRPKDPACGYRHGLPACHSDERGLLVLKPWSDDEQAHGVVITYKELAHYEYVRRGCSIWRHTTSESEGV